MIDVNRVGSQALFCLLVQSFKMCEQYYVASKNVSWRCKRHTTASALAGRTKLPPNADETFFYIKKGAGVRKPKRYTYAKATA